MTSSEGALPSDEARARLAAIDRLLNGASSALRNAGHRHAGYSPDRAAALHALMLSITLADDVEEAASNFLSAALALVASSSAEQDALVPWLNGHDSRALVKDLFGPAIEPNQIDIVPTADLTSDHLALTRDSPSQSPQTVQQSDHLSGPGSSSSRPWLRRLLELLSSLWRQSDKQRRLHLVRKNVSAAASSLALRLPVVQASVRSAGLRKAAARAATRITYPTRRLHIQRTVRTTIAQGGFWTPVWRQGSLPTEYLFLIRRLSETDFAFARTRGALEELREQGLNVTLYPYEVDPRHVIDTLSPRNGTLRLQELQQRHPHARLVIVSEGREFVSPYTNTPMDWVDDLEVWARRALITPIPSADWGNIERVLHRDLGYSLSSSQEFGLENLYELLGGRGPIAPRMTNLRAPVTPTFVANPSRALTDDYTHADLANLIASLRVHLGETGFQWLSVCAFFPAMSAPIALHFGRQVLGNIDDGKFSHAFARLSGLPWMRIGHMPYAVRRAIVDSLSPDHRGKARAAAASILSMSNLSAEPARALPSGLTSGVGSDVLTLPIRIDAIGSNDGLQIDDLAIEWLSDGAQSEIDPLLDLDEQKLADLLAKKKPETISQPPTNPAAPIESADPIDNQQATSREQSKIRIFCGYSRADLEFVQWLDSELSHLGRYEFTMDLSDIAPGEAFQQRISNLIRDAEVVVFVLSPQAAHSKWLEWEVIEAHRLGKRIIPLVSSPLAGARFPTELQHLNYLFFSDEKAIDGSSRTEGLHKLVRALDMDIDWFRKHTRLLQRAIEWEAAERAPYRLLRGPDVSAAREFIRQKPRHSAELPSVLLDFIAASVASEELPSDVDRTTELDDSNEAFVFVSHANSDKMAIRHIVDALIAAGLKVCIDNPSRMGYSAGQIRESFLQLRPGARWPDEIDEALKRSGVVLACFSKRYGGISTLFSDVQLALAANKLVACLVDDIDLQSLPASLRSTRILDVRQTMPSSQLKASLDLLTERVRRKLDQSSLHARTRRSRRLESLTDAFDVPSLYAIGRRSQIEIAKMIMDNLRSESGMRPAVIAGPDNECPVGLLEYLERYPWDGSPQFRRVNVEWPLSNGAFAEAYRNRLSRALGLRSDANDTDIAKLMLREQSPMIVVSLLLTSQWRRDEASRVDAWIQFWEQVQEQNTKPKSVMPILVVALGSPEPGWRAAFPQRQSADSDRAILETLQRISNSRIRGSGKGSAALTLLPVLGPVTQGDIIAWARSTLGRSEDFEDAVAAATMKLFSRAGSVPLREVVEAVRPVLMR